MATKTPKQMLVEAPKIPEELKRAALPSPITPAEQKKFLEQARGELSPLQKAFGQQLTAQQGIIGQETEQLKARLKETAQAEQAQLAGQLTERGFLRSGEQIGRGEKITGSLIQNLATADLTRASKLADLALQSAQFEADIQTEAQRRAERLGEQEFGRRELGAGVARQQIEDIRQEFERQLRLENIRLANARSSVSKRSTQLAEIGGRTKLIDTQTGEVIQDLGISSETQGLGADELVGFKQTLTQQLQQDIKSGRSRDESLEESLFTYGSLGEKTIEETYNKFWPDREQQKSAVQQNVSKLFSDLFSQ